MASNTAFSTSQPARPRDNGSRTKVDYCFLTTRYNRHVVTHVYLNYLTVRNHILYLTQTTSLSNSILVKCQTGKIRTFEQYAAVTKYLRADCMIIEVEEPQEKRCRTEL